MTVLGFPQWFGVFAVLMSLLCLGGCDRKQEESKRLTRNRDNAAVVVVGGQSGAADFAAEVEPNDAVAEAQRLQVDSGVTGTLNGSTDEDRYGFTVLEAGLVFASVAGAEDADLMLQLQDGEGVILAASDRGPAKVEEGLSGYWCDADQTYQLVVKEFTKKRNRKTGGRLGESAPYRLSLRQSAEPKTGFELESNEDLEGAMEVSPGEERFGFIGWTQDVDLWRLPVAGFTDIGAELDGGEKSALNIVLSGIEGVSTQLQLLDSNSTVLMKLQAKKGQEVALRSFVPEVTAEFYLIKVTAKRSNPVQSYALRVEETRLASGQEEEPNDALEQATVISGDLTTLVTMSGEVSLGDVDSFSIPPNTSHRLLELDIAGPSNADLDVVVLNEEGAELARSESAVVGAREFLRNISIAAGSSPIIRVTVKQLIAPATYRLSLTLVPGVAPAPTPLPLPEEVVPVTP